MLDQDTRTAILRLRTEGHGIRAIARALNVHRRSVREVLDSGSKEVPEVDRPEILEPHIDRIRELYAECKGNRIRVHEELKARANVEVPYSTLTRFCRVHEIGVEEKEAAGHYHFAAGQEMQHDTSPHEVVVGGKKRLLQCASLVLCFSRMIFIQVYETFNRFLAKIFLTDALQYFQGAAGKCVIDNTHVVVASGSGANAVMAPEMEAFAKRFDFTFVAHELGDANRSARVERPFSYVENNFYAGRTFADLADLNRQAIEWCDKGNATFKPRLQAKPIELFQAERPCLKPLPIFVPEVYAVFYRTVDVDGNVNLHTNRYPVAAEEIGQEVSVRETKNHVRIFRGHKLLADYERLEQSARELAKRGEAPFVGERPKREGLPPLPEENALRTAASELGAMVDALRKKHGGRAVQAVRHLHRMFLDYDTEVLRKVVAVALQHGLLDLERIERMVLRNIAGDFFRLSLEPAEGDDQ